MGEVLSGLVGVLSQAGNMLLSNEGVLCWIIPLFIVSGVFDIVTRFLGRFRAERRWWLGVGKGRQHIVAPPTWSDVEWRAYQFMRKRGGDL